MKDNQLYVSLEKVNELIELYKERDSYNQKEYKDNVQGYINSKINYIRNSGIAIKGGNK